MIRPRHLLVAAVVLAAVPAACRGGGPTGTAVPSPTSDPATPGTTATPVPTSTPLVDPTVVAARRTDLATVTDLFATHHVAPLDLGSDLPTDAELAAMTGPEFLATVMAATAGRARDGHSGVFPLAQPDLRLWPLQLHPFADGWRVVAALPGHDDLVGRQVTAIGGRDPDAAAELVAPLVPRDNDASLVGRLPQYLVVPEVLAGVGLAPTLALDGEAVTLDTVPARDHATHFDLFDPLVCPGMPSAVPTWDVRTGDDAVVVRWGRVVFRLEGRSHREFVDEVATTIASPTLRAWCWTCGTTPAGNCPMGGAPGLWADARVHRLPESGIRVHVAGAYGDLDLPVAIVPDVEVPPRWDDHDAGRDPALAAALQR